MTNDLKNGWFLSQNEDGTLTLHNSDQGQRIQLPQESASALRQALVPLHRFDPEKANGFAVVCSGLLSRSSH